MGRREAAPGKVGVEFQAFKASTPQKQACLAGCLLCNFLKCRRGRYGVAGHASPCRLVAYLEKCPPIASPACIISKGRGIAWKTLAAISRQLCGSWTTPARAPQSLSPTTMCYHLNTYIRYACDHKYRTRRHYVSVLHMWIPQLTVDRSTATPCTASSATSTCRSPMIAHAKK